MTIYAVLSARIRGLTIYVRTTWLEIARSLNAVNWWSAGSRLAPIARVKPDVMTVTQLRACNVLRALKNLTPKEKKRRNKCIETLSSSL
jgi:hypothetical protein